MFGKRNRTFTNRLLTFCCLLAFVGLLLPQNSSFDEKRNPASLYMPQEGGGDGFGS